jgi:hypothetical protein
VHASGNSAQHHDFGAVKRQLQALQALYLGRSTDFSLFFLQFSSRLALVQMQPRCWAAMEDSQSTSFGA